jgi:hypothetical protein
VVLEIEQDLLEELFGDVVPRCDLGNEDSFTLRRLGKVEQGAQRVLGFL